MALYLRHLMGGKFKESLHQSSLLLAQIESPSGNETALGLPKMETWRIRGIPEGPGVGLDDAVSHRAVEQQPVPGTPPPNGPAIAHLRHVQPRAAAPPEGAARPDRDAAARRDARGRGRPQDVARAAGPRRGHRVRGRELLPAVPVQQQLPARLARGHLPLERAVPRADAPAYLLQRAHLPLDPLRLVVARPHHLLRVPVDTKHAQQLHRQRAAAGQRHVRRQLPGTESEANELGIPRRFGVIEFDLRDHAPSRGRAASRTLDLWGNTHLGRVFGHILPRSLLPSISFSLLSFFGWLGSDFEGPALATLRPSGKLEAVVSGVGYLASTWMARIDMVGEGRWPRTSQVGETTTLIM